MKLNRVIASMCRQRILLKLSMEKELTMMALVRKINSTYDEVNRNLQILQKEALITQQYIGRLRLIRLNLNNKNISILLKVLRSVEFSANFQEAEEQTAFV